MKIGLEDQDGLFERKLHVDKAYRNRLLLIALCQGGAQHFVDCKKGLKHTSGVKDLDVYSFYAEHPKVHWPYRRHGVEDFGPSEFGYRPADAPCKGKRLVGRHVDLMGRALTVDRQANPIDAVRSWLETGKSGTPWYLRQKAVVGLYPARYRGKVIWDANVDL